MIRTNELPPVEETEIEALLAFDRALASGTDPLVRDGPLSCLNPVHQCQRLLEAVWPRGVSPALELPDRLGRFSIVRELGRGGFGVVFLAEDSALLREVALKVPRPEVLVTPDVRRRFLREAEAASRLDHPLIVPGYEVGEDGTVCYIASAYCEGPTLAHWLRAQTAPVGIRTAARLVAVLAGAVAHAHSRGILHRDLKPGNILVTRTGAVPSPGDGLCHDLGFVPRICDFGLAKLLDQVSQETRTGVPIGSPEYMAPEQATGRLREHGRATDVYALGVILYELLTGRPPHRGDTDLETLRLVSDQEPASPRVLRPSLPRDLETIALKCLEKRPARRYLDASDLAADLERFLNNRPVHARPIPAWERAIKWARRRPVHAALFVALLALALALLATLEWAHTVEKQHGEKLRAALAHSQQSEFEARAHRASAERERILSFNDRAADQLKIAGLLADRREYGPVRSILDSLTAVDGASGPRGFAWNLLDQLVRPRTTMLPGLPSTARNIACSSDGRTIALSDDANHAFLVDSTTGIVKRLPGEPRFAICSRLKFSPDGRTLASVSYRAKDPRNRNEVKIWDVASAALVVGMPADLGLCYQLLFSPDGRTLVTAEGVGSNRASPIRAWRLSDDRKRVTLCESLDGNQVLTHLSPAVRLSGPDDHPFRISDVVAVTGPDIKSGLLASFSPETGTIELAYVGSGYIKAIGHQAGSEVVFIPRTDTENAYTPVEVAEMGREISTLTAGKRTRPILGNLAVLWGLFCHDGRAAVVLLRDPDRTRGAVCLVDVASQRTRVEFVWGDLPARPQFALTSRGDALIVTGFDSRARVRDFHGCRAPGMVAGHKKEVWGLAFSPSGQSLVSSSDDGTIKFWNLTSGEEQRTLTGHGSLVAAVAYSPDGQLLASAGWDRNVRIWDAKSGAEIATLTGHDGRVRSVAFSPDGRTLVSAGDDNHIRVWDVATRRAVRLPLTGHTGTVFSLAVAPEGTTLYSGSGDKTIRVWDWSSRQCLATWPAEHEVYALKLSPDGQTLAAAQPRGTIRLWDVKEETVRLSLRGHAGDVLGIAFSPDGSTLASAGRDKTVRLWDLRSGHEQLTLNGHQAAVHAIAFSPDGTMLATGSYDGAIELWRASPEPAGHHLQADSRNGTFHDRRE